MQSACDETSYYYFGEMKIIKRNSSKIGRKWIGTIDISIGNTIRYKLSYKTLSDIEEVGFTLFVGILKQ